MCLTDNNFKNLPTGDVVDKLLKEWGLQGIAEGTADANGFYEASLLHGEYQVQISHPKLKNSSLSRSFSVEPQIASQQRTDDVLLLGASV